MEAIDRTCIGVAVLCATIVRDVGPTWLKADGLGSGCCFRQLEQPTQTPVASVSPCRRPHGPRPWGGAPERGDRVQLW